MTSRKKRLWLLGLALALLAVATTLVVRVFQENLVFFYTPTQVHEGKAPEGRLFRVGGLVQEGSIVRAPDGLDVSFVITDTAFDVPVTYRGGLPDLFKEGKGAVVQGQLTEKGAFVATQVLAKHDENYMPPEAQAALDKAHSPSTLSSESPVQRSRP